MSGKTVIFLKTCLDKFTAAKKLFVRLVMSINEVLVKNDGLIRPWNFRNIFADFSRKNWKYFKQTNIGSSATQA